MGEPAPQRPRSAFRPDIEGMRAVAVLLVLLYHGGLSWVPGGFIGVDVFFVVSGFLITGLLMRELESQGRIRLARFYARRAKRLLPATGVVLVVTAVLTWFTAPAVHLRTFGLDIVAAAAYVVNWTLAARSVDYLAEDVAPSPVQHFWSLAVEEQFYLIWPLALILVGLWIRRRSSARPRLVMLVGLLAIVIPSFLWSVLGTQANPQAAFFITPTRLWELGLGALVAVGAHRFSRLPAGLARFLGWGGLAAVLAGGVLITATTPWPGYAALLPTLGTAAMVAAGCTLPAGGVARLLSVRPAVWIGGMSYSLYLWHWPLLMAAQYRWGELSTGTGLLVVAASVVPAWLSLRFLENPIRHARSLARSNRLALSVGANFTLLGVAAGLVILALAAPAAARPGTGEQPEATGPVGAAALHLPPAGDAPRAGSVESLAAVEWFTPQPAEAPNSRPRSYDEGCQQNQNDAEVVTCGWVQGGTQGRVAVVGDSKIVQWESALEAVAQDQQWQLVAHVKSACAFSAGVQLLDSGETYASCVEWNSNVVDELLASAPDVVVVSSRATRALADPQDTGSSSNEAMVDALATQWRKLTDAGIGVVVLLDNPSPPFSVYECVAENRDNLAVCAFDRSEAVSRSAAPVQLEAAGRVPGVQIVDLTQMICPEEQCVPIIGDVLLYRQGSHLTDTYVRTLSQDLATQLVPAVERARKH